VQPVANDPAPSSILDGPGRQWQLHNMFRSSPTVFLIAATGDEHYDSVRRIVERTAADVGLELLLPDRDTSTTGDLVDVVERADMVVTDISRMPPNSMLLLGIALALRKPLLAFTRDASLQALPPSLSSLRILTYRPDDTEKLAWYLKEWVHDHAKRVAA
jgi:hypothetical protein